MPFLTAVKLGYIMLQHVMYQYSKKKKKKKRTTCLASGQLLQNRALLNKRQKASLGFLHGSINCLNAAETSMKFAKIWREGKNLAQWVKKQRGAGWWEPASDKGGKSYFKGFITLPRFLLINLKIPQQASSFLKRSATKWRQLKLIRLKYPYHKLACSPPQSHTHNHRN